MSLVAALLGLYDADAARVEHDVRVLRDAVSVDSVQLWADDDAPGEGA